MESEDFSQWTTYKERMRAAESRANVLQRLLKEQQALLAAVIRKVGTIRLTPSEWWNDRSLDVLGVKVTTAIGDLSEKEKHDIVLTLDGIHGKRKAVAEDLGIQLNGRETL